MTKVEELRKGLLLQVSMMQRHVELVDRLISAAHVEGVAEGAAAEKKKWIDGHEADEDTLQRARVLRTRLEDIARFKGDEQ